MRNLLTYLLILVTTITFGQNEGLKYETNWKAIDGKYTAELINQILEDEKDGILNVNADTAAGHLAKSLNAKKLVFQSDVEGVLDFNGRVIPHMTRTQANEIIKSGIAKEGMIPKIEACINSLSNVSSTPVLLVPSLG
mgnify:CR=1 FL=1